MPLDYRNLAVETLADSEAALKAEVRALVDLIADLAFENFVLRRVWEQELIARIHGDAALARCHRCLDRGPSDDEERTPSHGA